MKQIKMVACMSVLMFAGGCAMFGGRRGEPIQDIDNSAVTIVGEQTMKEIVMRAAHQKRWVPVAVDEGTVRCTLDLRGHQVVVDVLCLDSAFSIHYVSSENMNHDPDSNTINPKYNQWVRNLQREIVGQAMRR